MNSDVILEIISDLKSELNSSKFINNILNERVLKLEEEIKNLKEKYEIIENDKYNLYSEIFELNKEKERLNA